MSRMWNQQEIDKMLEYRSRGYTEKKIADLMSLVFMRPFSDRGVNRKIRDLKRAGLIRKNRHNGRYRSNISHDNRDGEMHKRVAPERKKKNRPLGRKNKCSAIGSEQWLKEREGDNR